MGEALCVFQNLVLGLALSGITGIRASIPIFVVAFGSKVWDGFPLTLAHEHAWLESWPSIIFFGLFLVVEIVTDKVPIAAEAMDGVFIIVKPIVGTVVALAPHYGQDGFNKLFYQASTVVSSAALSGLVALAKSAETAAIDFASCGVGAPIRSMTEDGVAVSALITILWLGFMSALIVVFVCALFGCCLFSMYWKRRRRKQKICKNSESWFDCESSDISEDSSDEAEDARELHAK